MNEPHLSDPGLRSARIRPYRLTFSSEASRKYGPYRHGRLVSLTSRSGVTGWGDAAPLPGFSSDSVHDIDLAWPRVTDHLDHLGVEETDILNQFPPSLVFALEQALLSIEAQTTNRHPAALISTEHRSRIAINGLVDCAPEKSVADSCALIDDGCSCIKIKVGHWPLDSGIRAVKEVRTALGADVEIRLDANRAWSLDEATQFLEGVSESDIAYIEEPLVDSDELRDLASRTSVALALDESLLGLDPGRLSEFSFARFLVVKPTILGGIRRSLEWARTASTMGMTSVISSAFESGLGTLWLLALCASPDFDVTAGLGTNRYLETDILHPRLQLGYNPSLNVTERALEPPTIDD